MLSSAGLPFSRGVCMTRPLTGQQLQVLRLIDQGMNYAGVSLELEISVSGVRQHLRNASANLAAPAGTRTAGLIEMARAAGYEL